MTYPFSLGRENIPSSLNTPNVKNLKWSFVFLRQDFQALGSQGPFPCTWLHSLFLSGLFLFFFSFISLIFYLEDFFFLQGLFHGLNFQRSPTDNVSRYLRWGMTSGWMITHRRGCWGSELRYPISDNPSVHGPARATRDVKGGTCYSRGFQPVFHRPLASRSCLRGVYKR